MANRRKYSREYLNDFKLNKQGKYNYTGSTYKLDESKQKELVKKLWIYVIVLDVIVLVSGCLNTGNLSTSIYYVLPYLLDVLFAGLLTYSVIKFNYHKKNLREYQYEKSIKRIKPYGSVMIICTIAQIVAIIVYLFVSKSNNNAPAVVIILFVLLGVQFILTKLTMDLVEKQFLFTKKEGKKIEELKDAPKSIEKK